MNQPHSLTFIRRDLNRSIRELRELRTHYDSFLNEYVTQAKFELDKAIKSVDEAALIVTEILHDLIPKMRDIT